MRMGLQLFAYSEIVVYEARSKTGLYKLNEATVLEAFPNIRFSLEKLAYASYFAEIANNAVGEDSPDEETLRLLLNSLFALERDLCSMEKIKTVYEWRIAAISGYEPQLADCCACGESDNEMFLSLSEGRIFCSKCAADKSGCAKLTPVMRQILKYICEAESKKIFSFDTNEKTIEYLGVLGEQYIQLQLDKDFSTLEYLKKVLNPEF